MLKKYYIVGTVTVVVETVAESIEEARKYASSDITNEIKMTDLDGNNFHIDTIIECPRSEGAIHSGE